MVHREKLKRGEGRVGKGSREASIEGEEQTPTICKKTYERDPREGGGREPRGKFKAEASQKT